MSEFETRLERIRRIELETVKPWFRAGSRVLEIGGGNGYQASVIASWGCEVNSLDVDNRPDWPVTYYEVNNYDGVNIPFPEQSFDVIFSSNVLEHVRPDNLPLLLKEMVRTLKKPSGVVIHILPTSSWRFWNNFAHYLYLIKYLTGYGKSAMMPTIPTRNQALKEYRLFTLIKRAILPGPHGEYPNALSELYFYSQNRWLREFAKVGFRSNQIIDLNIFYTGYGLIESLPLAKRAGLARWLGNATRGYVLRASD